jgi:hypothetical protein
MSDKKSAVCCLVLSIIGWIVGFCALMFERISWTADEFEDLAYFAFFYVFGIAACVIHLSSIIVVLFHLIKKKHYKGICLLGFALSIVYLIIFGILFGPFFLYSPDEETSERPPYGSDTRWKQYTQIHHDPSREITLREGLSSLCFAVSADCQKALYETRTANYTPIINLIDLNTGSNILTLKGHRAFLQCLAFSHNGKRAISGGNDGTLCYWDIESGKLISHVKAHKSYIRSIAHSPVSDQALTGDDDGTILLWDLGEMKIIRKFVGHTSGIRLGGCLVWAHDGKTFLSGSWDWSIRLWDVQTGKELSHLQAGYGRVMSLALSPNRKFALSSYLSGPDQPVIFWDMENKRVINSFGVPGNPWYADQQLHIASVAFSPDGRTTLFGLTFGTVIWWDLNEWQPIAMNHLHDKELTFVTFTPDGKSCISVGCDIHAVKENAKLRFWRLPTQQSTEKSEVDSTEQQPPIDNELPVEK